MKKLYAFALAAGATLSVAAAPVTPDEALARLVADGPRKVASATSRYMLIEQKAYPQLYCFAAGDGYMVLPADDAAAPLLGYADEGTLDLSNPNLAYWLGVYDREIAALASTAAPRAIMRASRQPIAPMIATRWNQEAPYNDLCPTDNGKRCPTGCVATAMAQVMKYHAWPEKGTGSHSYSWQGETLSFDFGATTFDWQNMTDRYDANSTEAERSAVATLMYACGVSVNMSYTASESGAVSRDMGSALINYFGYDKGLAIAERNYYGLTDWEDMIYDELSAGRPVLYGGQGSAGGHQFVCDGYSADGYFHFNWGWGGMSDGYFLLTALDPPSLGVGGGAGGFNYNQNIMLGVQRPTEANTPVYAFYCGGFEASVASVALGSDVKFGNGFYNFSYFDSPADTRIGIKVDPADGSEPLYLSDSFGAMRPNYGLREITAHFPTDMKDGVYTLTPVFKVPGGDWTFMPSPLSANNKLTATVSGRTIAFSAPDAAKISVTDLKLETPLYWGETCKLTFKVTNSGKSEFYDGLIPVLISPDGTQLIAQGATYPVDVLPDSSQDAEYVGTFSAEVEPEPGTYLLGIVEPSGRLVCQPVEVTLNAAPESTTIEVRSLRMLSDEPLSGQGGARFRVEVECTEGYFASAVTVAVFHASGGADVAAANTETFYLGAGQSGESDVDVDVSHLPSGRYMAAVFAGGKQLSDAVYFNIDTSLGIVNVDVDVDVNGQAAAKVVYDMLGRRVSQPTRGMYIVNGRKVLY